MNFSTKPGVWALALTISLNQALPLSAAEGTSPDSQIISIDTSKPENCARVRSFLEVNRIDSSVLDRSCEQAPQVSLILIGDAQNGTQPIERSGEEEEQALRRVMDPEYRRQVIREMETPGFNRDYLKAYLHDFGQIVNTPLNWDRDDWTKATLVIAVTGAAFTQDEKIRDWILARRNNTTSNVARVAETFGNELIIPGLGILYAAGKLNDSPREVRAALYGLESVALTTVLIQGLKFTAHRHRPYAGDGNNVWDGPSMRSADSAVSFPSGHSGAAFSIAAVLDSEYSKQDGYRWVGPLVYSMAALTALSRVHDDKHWTSDVILGSAIGYSVGKWISHEHGPTSHRSRSKWRAVPVVTADGVMLMMEKPF